MTVTEQLDAGNLAGAIATATEDIKREPSRPELRMVLSELMCLIGNQERADTLMESAIKFYQKPAPGFQLMRNLIKAEVARQRCFQGSELPPGLSGTDAELGEALHVVANLCQGKLAEAAQMVAKINGRPSLQATISLNSGETVSGGDFRDLNDLTASIAELITLSGVYTWRSWSALKSLKFQPVKSLRDLIWRPVEIVQADETTLQAFLPCLYPGSCQVNDDSVRLGRQTTWIDLGLGLMSGRGQRMFLVGDATPSLLEIAEIHLSREV